MFLSKDEQPARRRSNPSYLCPRAPMMSRGGARGAPIKTGGPWGPHRKFEKKQNLHFSANFVFVSQSRGGPWAPKLNFYLHPIFYCFFIEYRQIISLVFSLGGIPKFFLLFASPIINTETCPCILNNYYQLNLKFEPILHAAFLKKF